eukprot:42394-Prorocentrum_lima.AAC.1
MEDKHKKDVQEIGDNCYNQDPKLGPGGWQVQLQGDRADLVQDGLCGKGLPQKGEWGDPEFCGWAQK